MKANLRTCSSRHTCDIRPDICKRMSRVRCDIFLLEACHSRSKTAAHTRPHLKRVDENEKKKTVYAFKGKTFKVTFWAVTLLF